MNENQLKKLAEKCAPRAFSIWQRILIRKTPFGDRRLQHKVELWRAWLSKRFALDDQYLPRGSFSDPPDPFLPKLLAAPDIDARHAVIVEEALIRATAEVNQEWRPRLERWDAKVVEAVRTVLIREGVTGREILGPGKCADRGAIPREYLVHALIDISSGQIREGARRWGNISVAAPPERRIEKSPTERQKLADWFRGAGSTFRNKPTREITEAFKKVVGRTVSDELVRQARKDCGLSNRPKRSQRR